MTGTDSALMHSAVAALGIFLGSFISEDAALLGAASLASTGLLNPVTALSSAALGICVGDLGLYTLARVLGPAISNHKWFIKRLTPERLQNAQQMSQRWGIPALAVSRFIPGTRLPMTVASGFLRMPLRRFASVSALGSVLWVLSVFGAVMTLSTHTSSIRLAFGIVAAVLFSSGVIATQWKRISTAVARLAKWEFWPAWFFYAPVAAMYLRLALRYRGLMLPAIANLNQKNGGLIGESKFEILQQLQLAAPESVATSFLLPSLVTAERLSLAEAAASRLGLSFPLVLKPDIGQRGAGFRIVRNWDEAAQYFDQVTAAVVLQEYVAGPHEAGIFYYRLPGESHGHIFAITEKVFPVVKGDGQHTLGELIEADSRARLLGHVYKARHRQSIDDAPPNGACIRLVQAGNHCQGAIFRNGMHLYSEALAERVHQISSGVAGFYIGRYDVRYASEEELRAGRFKIIELNGASSEATSIYDPLSKLREAYKVLYQQWELVFKIGAMNRARGFQTPSVKTMLGDLLDYRHLASQYPIAD